MFEHLLQLMVLFFVIFDPLASFAVFVTASYGMDKKEKKRTALLSIAVASVLSVAVLILGETLLTLFSTNLDEFRVAGGIILVILGIRMAMGIPLMNLDHFRNNSGRAIASIIGTPLLTGPAAITSIIVSVHDYGRIVTAVAVGIVLVVTALIFFQADFINRYTGHTGIQVFSTVLGLVTIAWGVKFVSAGLISIFHIGLA